MTSTIAFSILNIISTSKSFSTKTTLMYILAKCSLKHAIELENEICNKNKTLVKFEKFIFIYNNI